MTRQASVSGEGNVEGGENLALGSSQADQGSHQGSLGTSCQPSIPCPKADCFSTPEMVFSAETLESGLPRLYSGRSQEVTCPVGHSLLLLGPEEPPLAPLHPGGSLQDPTQARVSSSLISDPSAT